MFEPDFRLSDDEDAYLDLYEAYWAHWRGVFRQPADSAESFYRHLYTFELRQPEADIDGLVAAFHDAHAELSRQLYRSNDEDQHHFGLAVLAEEHDQIVIRALVIVHPDKVAEIDAVCPALHSGHALSIARFETERGDAEAPWQWLADQLRASATSTEEREPRCFALSPGLGLYPDDR